jgi:hypothetical protein
MALELKGLSLLRANSFFLFINLLVRTAATDACCRNTIQRYREFRAGPIERCLLLCR